MIGKVKVEKNDFGPFLLLESNPPRAAGFQKLGHRCFPALVMHPTGGPPASQVKSKSAKFSLRAGLKQLGGEDR